MNVNEDLLAYCVEHSSPQGDLLEWIYRQTHLKTLAPRMVSGPLQGRILSMISQLCNPRRILEIGTFTGYATLCLAEGLVPDGEIITLEIDKSYQHISDEAFSRSHYSGQITQLMGDALELLPKLDGNFDLVFMDAKKKDYPVYFDLIIDKMSSGGVILADNILWSGKVLHENKDKTTEAIHRFNQKILEDPRVMSVILPIRDGINIIRIK